MNWILQNLWLIPVLPLIAAGVTSLAKQGQRKFAAGMAIGSMGGSLILSCVAFANALQHSHPGQVTRQFRNFTWFTFGNSPVMLGWVLDPLTAVMLMMVCFVGLLIFIYSVGYMSHDVNFTRFFCFLSLFASAMLGVVIANSLLLLFICWELVGLTSFLLIGFWYHKPSAAAAAKKAFITTRIGDLAFLIGMVWLYSQAGTLSFYQENGKGCLDHATLARLAAQTLSGGMALSTCISLLIFGGAVGKSGQVPLHVWLPDAMEGPTPVSALIHAATMVAAGVFLVARVYPLMAAPEISPEAITTALKVVTWVGAITAVFAATIAVAQTDIKRILAYSTVSQLGFMMMGLGVGGVAVGMFHLITHAFFKALLFMGAGSVIHGCNEEQDIRRMGGIREFMPWTFLTYSIGMMALSGVPIFFSGFWSKDAILHAAHGWKVSEWPFYLAVFGALLTAFYMTRQMFYVFFGIYRGDIPSSPTKVTKSNAHGSPALAEEYKSGELPLSEFLNRLAEVGAQKKIGVTAKLAASEPHESPTIMVVPLAILAVCTVLLGFLGTPARPWFQNFLDGTPTEPTVPGAPAFDLSRWTEPAVFRILLLSTFIATIGIGLGYWFYGRKPVSQPDEIDILERKRPDIFALLRRQYFVDEVYAYVFGGLNRWWANSCDWLDTLIWGGLVAAAAYIVKGLSAASRFIDENLVNLGFDQGCRGVREGGSLMSRLQNGRVQTYLRVIGIALTVLVLALMWGCRAS